MTLVVLQILLGLMGLINLWVKEYYSAERKHDNTVKAVMDDGSDLDADIAERVDDIVRGESLGDAGEPSTEDAQRRLDAL